MIGVVLNMTGVVLIMTEYVITLTVSPKYNWIGPQQDIWFFGAYFLLPSLAVKWRLNTDTDTDKSPKGADWPNGQSPSQCCNPWLPGAVLQPLITWSSVAVLEHFPQLDWTHNRASHRRWDSNTDADYMVRFSPLKFTHWYKLFICKFTFFPPYPNSRKAN